MIALSPSSRPTMLWVAGVGVAVLVAGCGRSGSAAGDAQPGSDTLPMPTVSTQLIDAGATPRERLVPPDPSASAGTAQHVTLNVRKDMRQQIGDQPQERFRTPDVTIGLTARVGVGRVDLTVGSATSSDPTLATKLQPAPGATAALLTDARGAVTAFQLDTEAVTAPEARSALERSVTQAVLQQIVFPDAAIGAGAVWLIRRDMPGRVPLEQTTRAKLLSRDNGVLRVGVTIDQRTSLTVLASADRMAVIGTPLADDPIRGAGVYVIDRRFPLPVACDVSIDGDRLYRDATGTVQLRQTTATRVHWGP